MGKIPNQYLLCTDLDRTLIPNGIQPESPLAKERFARLVKRKEIVLVYVTGRHRALIEQAITDYELPLPDLAIADVGTSIFQIDSSGWRHWDEWTSHIAPDWHGLTHEQLYRTLSVFSHLRLQEPEKQNTHKLSFYTPLDTDPKRLLEEIDNHLKYSGIKAKLIWSVDEAATTGLLDVLPASASKLNAIRFLMHQKGFNLENTLFAGDSGNDLDVMLSDISSVLVANADKDIKGRVAQANTNTLYVAKGGFLGMNGNYSAGILEGSAHYWPETVKWILEME